MRAPTSWGNFVQVPTVSIDHSSTSAKHTDQPRRNRRLPQWLCAAALAFAAPLSFAADVVEFYNAGLDNYFITADPNEATAVDNGGAGPGWIRTGERFGSMGITPVCRFYGSMNPGPNSHFYTSSQTECDQLKNIQATTAATVKRWNFESLDFFTTAPANGVCPRNTVPVYRAYNNGFARGIDSNHRITSNPAAIQQVVARGWISEGIVMCGSNATFEAEAANASAQLKGIWVAYSFSGTWPQLMKFDTNAYMLATTFTSPAGFEYGVMRYDPNNGRFYAAPTKDTNGPVGFSNRATADKEQSLRLEGAELVARRPDGIEVARYKKLTSAPSSIVGGWGSSQQFASNNLFFFPDGHFVFVDVTGNSTACGSPGLEYGTYAWSASTLDLVVTGTSVDTDGCGGLRDSRLLTFKTQLLSGGSTLLLTNPDTPGAPPLSFTRLAP